MSSACFRSERPYKNVIISSLSFDINVTGSFDLKTEGDFANVPPVYDFRVH